MHLINKRYLFPLFKFQKCYKPDKQISSSPIFKKFHTYYKSDKQISSILIFFYFTHTINLITRDLNASLKATTTINLINRSVLFAIIFNFTHAINFINRSDLFPFFKFLKCYKPNKQISSIPLSFFLFTTCYKSDKQISSIPIS